MIIFLNKVISVFLSAICVMGSLFGYKAADKVEAKQFEMPGDGSCYVGNGRVSVHDPSIVQDKDGTYYVFGSHACAAKSEDMITWENVACGVHDNNRMLVPEGETLRSALGDAFAWTDAFQVWKEYDESKWETAIWAADVIYNGAMEKYCYYACSSVWGTANSVIWMCTSNNIEGPYKFETTIVHSGINKLAHLKAIKKYPTHYSFTNLQSLIDNGTFAIWEVEKADFFKENGNYNLAEYPNAIDPTVFYDENGDLWMVYGSYSAGVYIMPMDEATGLPDYEYMKNNIEYDMYYGKKITKTNALNEGSGEGPYIVYDPISDYYYLYLTYCGLNALGGYNIREYRSRNVDGPYLDAAGNNALDDKNTGAKLFGNYKFDCLNTAYLAGGHSSSIVTDDGKMFQVYHTRFNYGHEGHEVRVHQMARTKNGWAVVLPFEYTGETIDYNGFNKDDLVGEYEFINHGTISNGCTDWADVNNIIAPTQNITLNADGTISNLKAYESRKQNTAVSSRDVSGIWTVKDGTAYITFVIDGVTYEGIFCKQIDESKEKTEKIVFSAMGNNNECIWGVKK